MENVKCLECDFTENAELWDERNTLEKKKKLKLGCIQVTTSPEKRDGKRS